MNEKDDQEAGELWADLSEFERNVLDQAYVSLWHIERGEPGPKPNSYRRYILDHARAIFTRVKSEYSDVTLLRLAKYCYDFVSFVRRTTDRYIQDELDKEQLSKRKKKENPESTYFKKLRKEFLLGAEKKGDDNV